MLRRAFLGGSLLTIATPAIVSAQGVCKRRSHHLWRRVALSCLALSFGAIGADGARALVGGKKGDEKTFPATVRFYGSETCTATIVGPRTVMSAAHCFEPGGKKPVVELLDAKKHELTCQRHPDYKAKGRCEKHGDKACAADIVLCSSSVDLTAAGLKYESVLTDRSKITLNNEGVLLGFGCTKDGVIEFINLHVGTSTIKRLSKDDPKQAFLDQFILMIGGAHSCLGDSGAGALDSVDEKQRFVIGVISAGSTSSTQLVPTSDKRIADFLKNWGDSAKSPICGVHKNVKGCR